MNYRHAYHAGNFADVMKHAVLALVIEHLKKKEAPFRVIDAHAGAGRYDLEGREAGKTGEAKAGILRLLAAPLPTAPAALMRAYLDAVATENPDGQCRIYPGSPVIARRLMRPGDQLIANELHPDDGRALEAALAGARDTKVLHLDAWTAVKALLPPKERRGVILVDPPFEAAGDLDRLVSGLADIAVRFATGTVLLWYPVKSLRETTRFHARLEATGLPRLLAAELMIGPWREPPVLSGCGLIVMNAPHTLETDLSHLLPCLAERLAQGPGAGHRLIRLSGEHVPQRSMP